MTTATMLYGIVALGTTLLLQGDVSTAHKVVTAVWNSTIVIFMNIVTTIYDWFKED